MSIIARITFPLDEVALTTASPDSAAPGMRLKHVASAGDRVRSYAMVADDAVRELERTARRETTFERFEVLDRLNQRALVRIDANSPDDGVFRTLIETDGTILDAVGTTDGWSFDLRFDDHDHLATFYQDSRAQGLTAGVEWINTDSTVEPDALLDHPAGGDGTGDIDRRSRPVATDDEFERELESLLRRAYDGGIVPDPLWTIRSGPAPEYPDWEITIEQVQKDG